MSVKPFTNDLQMWSPTPSIEYHNISTEDFNYSTMQPSFHCNYYESRNYHHEPLYYPAVCMLCGLPHTKTSLIPSPTACQPMTTPAPVIDIATTLPAFPVEERCTTIKSRPLQLMKKIKLSVCELFTFILRKFKSNRPIYPLHKNTA